MNWWRLFGLSQATPAERRATFWVGVMFFASLASMFLVAPLRNQFGVHEGVERMPYLYSLTLLATVVLVVPFWWLANRMPSRRFVPIVLHASTAGLVALAFGLSAIGDYDWHRVAWFGELFWGGFSAMNVAVPALVWIHAVEHFGKEQGKRLFGLIAVGGTLGTIAGAWGARLLSGDGVPLWLVGAVAAAVLQLAWLAFVASQRHCRQLDGGGAAARHASGGMWQAVRILARDARAQQIALYMVLIGFVATAFEAAQTELVGNEIQRARDQNAWLADVRAWGNGLVLCLQVFCTGRMMTGLSPFVLLAALPLLSIAGLGVFWAAPTAATIFAVQVARRGAQYAVEKPAREVLYTPLDLATKHKVKFLLETFAFRLGDLGGAAAQAGMRDLGLGTGGIAAVTVLFALSWIGLAWSLGRDRRAELVVS